MKKRTKMLSFLLAVVFCLFALTACRKEQPKDNAVSSQAPISSVSDSAKPEPETTSETTTESETQSETQTELTTEEAPEDMVGYEEAVGEEE